MSKPSHRPDIDAYEQAYEQACEQACDQAIAMCNGNLRSTIKALIMANEYLEMELNELRAASQERGGLESSRANTGTG